MQILYIIGGPNGAGKTTAAFNLLPDVFKTIEFVNADEIAKGISPLNPEGVALQAGRIMLNRIDTLLAERKSFAFESTLSGLSYIDLIRKAKLSGYYVVLFFVYLESEEIAIERVASRVKKGGHNIPVDVIRRRYKKGIGNFVKYSDEVDDCYLYNNTDEYELIAKYVDDVETIFKVESFEKIIKHEHQR
jgi:predicted ABC-type ATPase